MRIERAMRFMELERECVLRQGGTDCPRNVDPIRGCYGCKLVVNDGNEIVEAYDYVISILKGISIIKDKIAEKENEDNE